MQKDTDSIISFSDDAWDASWEEDSCYFNADKYLEAQDRWDTYQKALKEVKKGKKRRHWIWFIFPQMFGFGTSELARFMGYMVVMKLKNTLNTLFNGKDWWKSQKLFTTTKIPFMKYSAMML